MLNKQIDAIQVLNYTTQEKYIPLIRPNGRMAHLIITMHITVIVG